VSSPSPEDLERQVQEDLMRLDSYRNQLNQMLQQYQLLAASRTDHVRARQSLEGLERAGEDSSVLIPLGGEAYIEGHPDRSGPVLLGIGSGYVAEIERPKALELIQQRTKQIEDAVTDLEGQMRTLEERMNLISRRVEAMSARAPGPGEGFAGNVGRD
jgi:prefoldin alpha subunit